MTTDAVAMRVVAKATDEARHRVALSRRYSPTLISISWTASGPGTIWRVCTVHGWFVMRMTVRREGAADFEERGREKSIRARRRKLDTAKMDLEPPRSAGPCCVGDEGRPLEAAVQAEASNHPLLLPLREVVVSELGDGRA